MPTTINGIGTHYYGKKNPSVRTGTCRSCGSTGDLKSYDTRLWFVVFFIPVVPLGRKRIIDSCPACQRHYAADQDQFAMARQLSLSGARDQFNSDPTPETAMAVHAEMLGFHAHDEAQTFREETLAKFPHDATLHAAYGAQLDDVSEYDQATPLYEKAYQLDPSLPAAHDGMALRKIVDGRLDEARQLASFLEQPGAGQLYPLRRLEQLAEAYQKAGRHQDALDLSAVMIRELPDIADHHLFRKFIAKSEKATRPAESLLSKRKASWRSLFDTRSTAYSSGQRWAAYLGIVAVLIVAGMAALNEYRRLNRTVIVRNEFGPSAQVVIDGKIAVPPGTQSEVVLKEGPHHVSVTGAIDEEFDIDMASDYWQHWTHSPAWVINVGGAAQLVNSTLYYAENPRPSEPNLIAGENVLYMPHVDYLFETAPDTLQVDNHGGEVVKHQLSIASESKLDVFHHVAGNISPEAGLRYAESQLVLDPANDDLLQAYVSNAAVNSQLERAKQFLKGQFDTRPVLVGWHRMFQELHTSAAEKNELISQYDELLMKEPNDAGLLYLRGRLTPDNKVSEEFFNRAIAADPELNYPWLALGYQACTRGDWARCKECLQKSLQLKQDDEINSTLQIARLALGESDEMEREYLLELESVDPSEALTAVLRTALVMVSRGELTRAKQLVADWGDKVSAEGEVKSALDEYCGLLEYMAGEMVAVNERVSSGTASPQLKQCWYLVTGKPEEALNDAVVQPLLESPWNALMVSLAFDLAGNAGNAKVWRDKAAEELAKLDFDEVMVAEVLRSERPPTEAEIVEIGILPAEKSLVLAALAIRFPEHHDELAALAKRFDVQPSEYGPLVRKAIAQQP